MEAKSHLEKRNLLPLRYIRMSANKVYYLNFVGSWGAEKQARGTNSGVREWGLVLRNIRWDLGF